MSFHALQLLVIFDEVFHQGTGVVFQQVPASLLAFRGQQLIERQSSFNMSDLTKGNNVLDILMLFVDKLHTQQYSNNMTRGLQIIQSGPHNPVMDTFSKHMLLGILLQCCLLQVLAKQMTP